MMELEQHTSGLWYRSGTYDLDVIKEQGCYAKIGYRPDDIVLDLGANIGAFAHRYGPLVSEIHCYEPDPENFELLCCNLDSLRKGRTLFFAHRIAVADYHGTATLYIQNGKNKGNHSLYQKGRLVHGEPTRTPLNVTVVRLDAVYSVVKPTIVKCDIEGGEYHSLLTTPTPEFVREIFVEIHFNGIKESQMKARLLIDKLVGEGFDIVRAPRFGPTLWHTLGHFVRS